MEHYKKIDRLCNPGFALAKMGADLTKYEFISYIGFNVGKIVKNLLR